MFSDDHWFLMGIKWFAAMAISFWLHTLPLSFHLLAFLCTIDLVCSLFTHSRSLAKSLKRIAILFLFCGAVNVTYYYAGQVGINVGTDVGNLVVLYYVFGELIEISLICKTIIGLPPWLVDWLEKAQGLTNPQGKPEAE